MPGPQVTLVIPARNAESTLSQCLASVVPLLYNDTLAEVVVVDDGSTDETEALIRTCGVTYLRGYGKGPASARNLGWQHAQTELIWFVDSDCVSQPDALTYLLPLVINEGFGAAGGSYANANPHSLVATLIHEEIVARHRRMPREVNFLATYNLLIRRDALEAVNGLDEIFLKAQDAELAFALKRAGYRLGFSESSRVAHYHLTSLAKYLSVQRKQGYWRMWLYKRFPSKAAGDSYANWTDYAQPPLAMLSLGSLILLPFTVSVPLTILLALVLLQVPMARRIAASGSRSVAVAYLPFGFVRAYWRGIGMVAGTLAVLFAGSGGNRSRAS